MPTLRPLDAAVALLGPGDLHGSAGERRSQLHNFVALFGRLVGIAAIERFCPNERCRIERMPLISTRSHLHAFAGDIVGQRNARDFVLHLARGVPDFHFFGKGILRVDVRKRAMDARYKEVFTVR